MTQNVPLEALIQARYPLPEWATIIEFSGGVGSSHYDRRADAVTFNCYPSTGWHRLAFEVKRTRADFMRELDHPMKRVWLENHFHKCYFVLLSGIAKEDEVPEGWGLLVATKTENKLIRRKEAKHREVGPLPEPLALSAIRSLANNLHTYQFRHYTFKGETISQKDLDTRVKEQLSAAESALKDEHNKVKRLHNELANQKAKLEAPLSTLANQAGEYGIFASWREAPLNITSEDVLRWIAHIKVHATRKVMVSVWKAREGLDELITATKAEGLEFGEPKRRTKQ